MNIFSKTVFAVLLTSVSLIADMWRIEGGTGLWSGSADGTIVHYVDNEVYNTIITDKLDEHKDSTAGYLYVTVKHPIPIVPNVRFEYVGVKGAGIIIDSPVPDIPFYDTTTRSELFLTQYDTILFYSLLDNMLWMTLDLGVDLKYITSQYVIDDLYVDDKSDSIVPMAYLRGRVEAPFAPLGFEADIKYITDGTSTVYDVRAKIDYSFKMNTALEPGVELGYRIQQFKVDGEKSDFLGDIFSLHTNTDLIFAGIYGGITVKF